MRRNGIIWTTAVATAIAFVAAPPADAQEPQPADQAELQEAENILDVAQERGFDEWTRGIQEAGLDQRLSDGTYTVFIADDAAYQEVPGTQTQAWQTDPAAHRSAIGYTIVEGRITRDELRQREFVTTIEGDRIPVRVDGDRIWLGDAELREADIEAGDGLIHRVDRVTWPDQAQEVEPVEPQPLRPQPVEPVEPQPVEPVEPQPVIEPVRKD